MMTESLEALKVRQAPTFEAACLGRRHGAISSYLYSTDNAFIDRSVDAYAESSMNLSINLHGAMWANFAATYSNYHVTGLNPGRWQN